MSQMLQIPLRAVLTTPRQNHWVSMSALLCRLRAPRGTLLLDTPVARLPKLPRRLRK